MSNTHGPTKYFLMSKPNQKDRILLRIGKNYYIESTKTNSKQRSQRSSVAYRYSCFSALLTTAIYSTPTYPPHSSAYYETIMKTSDFGISFYAVNKKKS